MTTQLSQYPYDQIAADYDSQWSVHVTEPQALLTERLQLRSGLRCVDLGCGTGVDTVDMLKRVTPGEVLAVDPSSAMLDRAMEHARHAGLVLRTRNETAEEFVAKSTAGSFDILTLRFTLGYLDWKTLLPKLACLLRPEGRIGILTILATSAPQAYATYRVMAVDLGLPQVALNGAPSNEQIAERLSTADVSVEFAWTHSLRLTFPTGERLAVFLRDSGIATHPALAMLPPLVASALWRDFAERIEVHREADGIPLDFDLGGIVARRGSLL